MTKNKEYGSVPKYRSLYIGLFYNILLGILLGFLVWGVITLPATYLIKRYYVSEEKQVERRTDYLEDLSSYVIENNVTLDNSSLVSDWILKNPYVFLLVYQSNAEKNPSSDDEAIAPGVTDSLIIHRGSRIDESIDRTQLVYSARSHGYYRLDLVDGSVIVAISEYTENFYYAAVGFISILAALIAFFLMLVRYIRIVIERIKRFESDVTIVSEIDMNYEIICEGADEITNLSEKVETMRRKMLDHIKNEQDARAANTELITSISHDIRTPLTVIMGYLEMMKEHDNDEVMESYVSATESTALRLKQLSDDMFRYSLLFGDSDKAVKLEEYDAITLFDQLLSEHIFLMRERGYDICLDETGGEVKEGSVLLTDPQNLMRIVDNVFSNMSKYADKDHPVFITKGVVGRNMIIEFKNKITANSEGAESNGIGLKTCRRLGELVAKRFEYEKDGEFFICRLVMELKEKRSE